MKVCVLGCAGFIGSNLCDYLLEKGHTVVGIDNLITGNRNNLKEAEKNPNFTFKWGDICDSQFSTKLQLGEVDWIFNAASIASPVHYMEYPLETILTNSIGLKNVLEYANQYKARVVHFSTSEIYGDPLNHPQKESDISHVNSVGERSSYDVSKCLGETLCYVYRNNYNLDIRIARIFNTYGSRMAVDDGRLIPAAVDAILHGKPLTLYGSGMQTRSFCYVSDMVKGLYSLMEKDHMQNELVNLGNPEEFTIWEFINLLQKITGKKLDFISQDARADDPQRRKPDIIRARVKMGWLPQVNLEEGLTETLNYFKQPS